jgi:sugar phosphate isomerase/epimerase
MRPLKQTLSRRDILRAGAAAAAVGAKASHAAATPSRKEVRIALQLFSLRDALGYRAKPPEKGDLPGTLATIAQMGFQGVEWYGWGGYFERTPKELRQLLDDNGLVSASDHIHAPMLQGDRFKQTLELHQTLGTKLLTLSELLGDREARATRQFWIDGAKLMTELAEKLRPYGIRLGLHNHGTELRRLPDGSLPWELVFDNTPKDVYQQLHLAAWPAAGLDPVAYIRRYPGRTASMHMTDYFPGKREVLLGEGQIPWLAVFEAAETVGGVEWYIVEQESYPVTPVESVRLSLANLRKLLAERDKRATANK